MIRNSLTFLIFFIFSNFCLSQISYQRDFGEVSTFEEFVAITTILNEPNHSLILGNKVLSAEGRNALWLVKIDIDGNELWSKDLTTEVDLFAQNIATLNDGYLILAMDFEEDLLRKSFGFLHLIKIDLEGNVIWQQRNAKSVKTRELFLAVNSLKNKFSIVCDEGTNFRDNRLKTYQSTGENTLDKVLFDEFAFANALTYTSSDELVYAQFHFNTFTYSLHKLNADGEVIEDFIANELDVSSKQVYDIIETENGFVVLGAVLYSLHSTQYPFIAFYSESGEFLHEIEFNNTEYSFLSGMRNLKITKTSEGFLCFFPNCCEWNFMGLTPNGEIVWINENTNVREDYKVSQINLIDGGAWIVGRTRIGSNLSPERDAFALKIDDFGVPLKEIVMGTEGKQHDESLYQVATTEDCGYLTFGHAFRSYDDNSILQKYNHAGELQWEDKFTLNSKARPMQLRILNDSITQLAYSRADEMVILNINTMTLEKEEVVYVLEDESHINIKQFKFTADNGGAILLRNGRFVKFDEVGNNQWSTDELFPNAYTFDEFEGGFFIGHHAILYKIDAETGTVEEVTSFVEELPNSSRISNIIPVPEGGYLMAARYIQNNRVFKLDSLLEIEWEHSFLNIDDELAQGQFFVDYLNAQRFMIHNNRGLPYPNFGNSEYSPSFKVINHLGNIVWDKKNITNERLDILDWVLDYDDGLIFVGNVYQGYSHDYKIIKTNLLGQVIDQPPYKFPTFNFFPNPVHDEMTVVFEAPLTEIIDFTFYNYLGNTLGNKKVEGCGDVRQYQVDVSDLPDGLLIMEMTIGEERTTKLLYKE